MMDPPSSDREPFDGVPAWFSAEGWIGRRLSETEATRLAIDLSRRNAESGGGPFAALLLQRGSGCVLAAGVNRVRAAANPVLHAEIMALATAGRDHWARGEATLISSCEPCVMCLGAIHWSGVDRVVFAALRADAEAAGFCEGAGAAELAAEMTARGVCFERGALRTEAAAVLRAYADGGGVIYGPARA